MMPTDTAQPGSTQPRRFAHPWTWMSIGLLATFSAFLWARLAPAGHHPLESVQVPVMAFGVLAAALAVWMSWAPFPQRGLEQLSPGLRRLLLFALAAINIAVVGAVSAWAVSKFDGAREIPGQRGGLILLWLVTVPWAACSALHLIRTVNRNQQPGERFERSLLVTQAGVACLLGSWALYWGQDQWQQWDSMRLFLAVLGAVAILMAPIVAASSPVRRLAVSALICLHFFGIITVILATPPGPWIAGVVHRVAVRPYLDFMFLGNAYRFYSPEPSEASQVWFRIEYAHKGKILSRWEKLPNLNDDGNHSYLTSVQYTRRLALTENVAKPDPAPPMMVITNDGRIAMGREYEARDQHSPTPLNKDVLGMPQSRDALKVPYHPDPTVPQYQKPNLEGLLLLGSYARHLLEIPHPEIPDAEPLSVKVYRVRHRIPLAQAIAAGVDPSDWIYYLPYYCGQFDRNGTLLDPGDPFLYWLLPILPNPDHPDEIVDCYVFKHAGDRRPDGTPDWQRRKKTKG